MKREKRGWEFDHDIMVEFDEWIKRSGYTKNQVTQLAIWLVQRLDGNTRDFVMAMMNRRAELDPMLMRAKLSVTPYDYVPDQQFHRALQDLLYEPARQAAANRMKGGGEGKK